MSSAIAFEAERASGFDGRPFRLVANVVELLEVARAEFERDREASKASITQATRILRSELERHEAVSKPDSSTGELAGWQVHRLRAYVESHLSETIHVKDLSEIARRSTAHFCRAFKRTFGQTPHAYVIAQRLERAKSLMLKSNEQLCVIAVLCGFTDQAHLSKLFRQHTGETPGAWRRRALDDHEPPIHAYSEARAPL
jgi:AraC family transcriptional regulator